MPHHQFKHPTKPGLATVKRTNKRNFPCLDLCKRLGMPD